MNANATPEQTPTDPPNPVGPVRPEEPKTNTRLLIGIIVAGLVFIIITVLIIWFLAYDPQRTANIRDMFIIALAFVSGAIGVLLVVLIWQLQSLIVLLRNEIKPMLVNANQTVNTVRGTAVFMSDNLAKPAIKVASFFSGIRGVADAVSARTGTSTRRRGPSSAAPGSSASAPSTPPPPSAPSAPPTPSSTNADGTVTGPGAGI